MYLNSSKSIVELYKKRVLVIWFFLFGTRNRKFKKNFVMKTNSCESFTCVNPKTGILSSIWTWKRWNHRLKLIAFWSCVLLWRRGKRRQLQNTAYFSGKVTYCLLFGWPMRSRRRWDFFGTRPWTNLLHGLFLLRSLHDTSSLSPPWLILF